jgi:hypothetical protein
MKLVMLGLNRFLRGYGVRWSEASFSPEAMLLEMLGLFSFVEDKKGRWSDALTSLGPYIGGVGARQFWRRHGVRWSEASFFPEAMILEMLGLYNDVEDIKDAEERLLFFFIPGF